MKKIRIWGAAIMTAVLCQGCGGALGGPEYKAWVESEDHGLRISQEVQGYVFTLQYEPDEYVVMHQSHTTALDKNALAAGLEEVRGYDHYQLRISRKDGGEVLASDHLPGELQTGRQEYFAFTAERDLHLKIAGAVVPPAFYHFESQMGLRPFITLVFAFPEMEGAGDMEVEFTDQKLTGETIRFVIPSESLKQIPSLRITSDSHEVICAFPTQQV